MVTVLIYHFAPSLVFLSKSWRGYILNVFLIGFPTVWSMWAHTSHTGARGVLSVHKLGVFRLGPIGWHPMPSN